MKNRVSNTAASLNGTASATSTSASAAEAAASNSAANNGRRSRLQSVDQVYLGNSNNNPLSPRTRASVKQEIDDEVSFV